MMIQITMYSFSPTVVSSARSRAVSIPLSDFGRGRVPARVGYRLAASSPSSSSSPAALDLEAAKELFESGGTLFVDMRSAREYDYEHITKPVRSTVNIPLRASGVSEDSDDSEVLSSDLDAFVGNVAARYGSSARLLLVDATGKHGVAAAEALQGQGYEHCYGVRGGYDLWMKRFTTTGRRRIQGKFVSSGKEALKSGLNLDAAVASTYEENHGRADLSLPSNRSK